MKAHFVAGFDSCARMIEDIEIDTPRGRELLSQFVTRSINAGYVYYYSSLLLSVLLSLMILIVVE